MSSTDELDILRHIDRLVDGELSRADESRLLARLDATPDGWRQLALAFVEGRRWRTAMLEQATMSQRTNEAAHADIEQSSVAPEAARLAAPASDSVLSASTSAAKAAAGGSRRLFAAALAASLLAGALGGLGIARWRADGRNATASSPGPSSPGPSPKSFQPGEVPAEPAPRREPNEAALADSERPIDASPSGERALTMFVGGGTSDGAKPIDIPVIPASQADPAWLDAEKASVPQTFREAMEKQGRVVNVRRQFYPVLLNDGRRVIVPIDDVEVR